MFTWSVSRPRDPDEVAADRHADEALERLGDAPHAPSPSVPEPFARAFGQDFGQVRLHTDSEAAEFARDLGADAVTVGHEILFGAGAYQPHTPSGRRLLAHELAHVVQHERDPRPRIRRHCVEAIAELVGSVVKLSGSLVHEIILLDFECQVAGAQRVRIPGGSAGPLRTGGLCGKDSPVIPGQSIGGRAGPGIPDLARQNTSGVLSVAEVKPASPECLVDGEEQLLRYIDQGNAQDDQQKAWRASQNITVVSPMLPTVYPAKLIVAGPLLIKTDWFGAGLLGYTVLTPPPVPVPQEEREKERKRLEEEARRRKAAVAFGAAVGAGVVVREVVKRALWRHFWRVVAERFAIRGAAALALAAADGPLPFGELVDVGLAIVTIVQIGIEWNDLWRKADEVAAKEA
ncbi:DUF4157 domain-containing protein [Streptomyces sp. NPDC002685]|uniref:eCIS core domain-containing protein n=1 Tax=Streptomyces sp. NPDC002685 TaxID=3154540 RepID=UPI003331AC75